MEYGHSKNYELKATVERKDCVFRWDFFNVFFVDYS